MSTLLLDIGNSRLKWARTAPRRRGSAGRLLGPGAAPRPEPEALAAFARRHWSRLRPRRVLAANVAGPSFAAALQDWCTGTWGLQAELVTAPARGWGVVNAYAEPARLGPDRWAALVAARRRTQGACCVVDAGTALTFDVLDREGRHLGGLIVPGLELMRRALLQGTGELAARAGPSGPDAPPAPATDALLARDTSQAVQAGTLYAAVATVDRVLADLEAELGGLARLLSGGDAPALLPLLSGRYDHAPHLVLEGLAIMAEEAP